MRADEIKSCLTPDHSSCDIFALELQGLADHRLCCSAARTEIRAPVASPMPVLLSC